MILPNPLQRGAIPCFVRSRSLSYVIKKLPYEQN